MKFFSSNLVSDSIDKLVKKPDISKEDVDQLCSLLNSRENGTKEATKALQNKLKSKDSRVILICLSLYEDLVERCGAKFQSYITSEKFLNILQKLVTYRYSEIIVRNRVIELLQLWIITFENVQSMSPIKILYEKLISQGNISAGDDANRATPEDIQPSAEHVEDSINSARSYSQMLAEALAFTDPETTNVTKDALIQEFYEKCKSSQAAIANFLALIDNEANISSLLKANQELINTLNLYNEMVERQFVAVATKASLVDSKTKELPECTPDDEQDPFADPRGSQISSKPSDKKLGKRPDYVAFESTADDTRLQKPLVPVATHAVI